MGVYINAPFDSELNEKAAAVCSPVVYDQFEWFAPRAH